MALAKKQVFFLAYFLLANSSVMADDTQGQPRDWIWVVRSLQANGVNPNAVPWATVNNACMRLTPGSEEFADCQYEKAMNRVQHGSDRTQCDAESVANYPDSLSDGAQTITTNASQTTVITHPRMTPSEIRTARIGYFRRCMTDMGWKNPDNYLMGKKDSDNVTEGK
jgi:hypothetical protein